MNFNWTLFFEPSPYGDGIYLNWLWDGFIVTVSLATSAWIIAFVLGSIVGILRTLKSRGLRKFGTVYVDVFRNIPLLVQMFAWYLLLPYMLPEAIREWFNQDLDPSINIFICATICLSLFTSARIAEQVRAGIESLPKGQRYAGIALGLSLWQVYWHILLPNTYRRIIPTLTSEMTNIVKNSSVASVIGLSDLIGQIDKLIDETNSVIETLCGVSIAFIIINYSVITIMRIVERKTRLPNSMSGG